MDFTQTEKDILAFIKNPDNEVNLCLVKTEFDGVLTSVVCQIERTEDNKDTLNPLAILVNEELFKRLKNPTL